MSEAAESDVGMVRVWGDVWVVRIRTVRTV